MPTKINVTTPVDFRVKEGIGGSFWISIDIGGAIDESLPSVLDDSLISIHPAAGVTFKEVEDIAQALRQSFETLHFQHPIQQ